MPVYLDCNATTPMEPGVRLAILAAMSEELGNAGSDTHQFGTRAKRSVEKARSQIASLVSACADEVIFTSGATESDNMAILGLAARGEQVGHRHIVTTEIEHKAVLEPVNELSRRGFEVTLVPPTRDGSVDPDALLRSVRSDTLLVSIMHVNNETGVIQSLTDVCRGMRNHHAYLHVDAAQGFGKELDQLRDPRIDLISLNGHKLYGPKGVGALIARKRNSTPPPLTPLFHGGGQERGLRPGTLPVPLIVGLGAAAEIAGREFEKRRETCVAFKRRATAALEGLAPRYNGNTEAALPTVMNISFPGIEAARAIAAIKRFIAVSSGAACTTHKFAPSHVLQAMGLPDAQVRGALRMSWCHMTEEPDWEGVSAVIRGLAKH